MKIFLTSLTLVCLAAAVSANIGKIVEHREFAEGFKPNRELLKRIHRGDARRSAPVSAPSSHAEWGYTNVLNHGAVADGVTDDSSAFQKALHAAQGGKVYVPSGAYMLNSSIVVPPYTVLQGVNAYPFSSFGGGSVLITNSGSGNASAAPFIFLKGPDAGVKGLTITYMNQEETQSTPTEYPPCIQGEGNNLSVLDMLLANPTVAIDFATFSCPRHLISNVYGQPLKLGITFDQIYDIGRIRHIHFWPFWTPAGSALEKYVHTHATTFLVKRSDWEVVEDIFSWGYNIGIQFTHSSHGACNGQFTNVNFDDVNIGIDVLHTQPYGILVSNLNLANAGNGQIREAIRCPSSAGSDSHLIVRGLSVWGQWNRAARWDCGGQLGVSEGIIFNWNASLPAFDLSAGRHNIRGLYFRDSIGTAFNVASTVDRALITANDLIGNTLVCNNSDHLCSGNLP